VKFRNLNFQILLCALCASAVDGFTTADRRLPTTFNTQPFAVISLRNPNVGNIQTFVPFVNFVVNFLSLRLCDE
jgi:hypothetical protein